jgi:plasmid replication initiation protein
MPDNSKVLKSKTKKVYKHNKLNKASFPTCNLNDYRVYLNAIALIGGVDSKGKYLQSDDINREYVLSAKDFSEQFNIDIKNAYRILKNSVDKLRKTDIKVERPDLRQTWYINVCELVKYNETEGTIAILFTGSIIEYLKQRSNNFTLYNLKEVADLTSLYAVRIYELMQQFSTSGMLINTIEKWREILAIKPEEYPRYTNLKAKVFTQAIKEINSKTGYNLIMIEHKEGRKVVRVEFNFKPDTVHNVFDKDDKKSTMHRKPSAKKVKNSAGDTVVPAVYPDQLELPI